MYSRNYIFLSVYSVVIIVLSSFLVIECDQHFLRKCCPFGQHYIGRNCSSVEDSETFVNNSESFLKVVNISNQPTVIIGDNCTADKERIILNRAYSPFTITNDLKLIIDEDESVLEPYESSDFCLEYKEEYNNYAAIVCTDAWQADVFDTIKNIGVIISLPFLLATIIIYSLLPERNLHMKALISYVISLLGAYTSLILDNMSTGYYSRTSCTILGISLLYFFVCSFLWMNSICIDIWFTFSGLRGLSGSKSEEQRRFMYYSFYAWGVSLIYVAAVFLIDTYTTQEYWYDPGIGVGQCFVADGWPSLVFVHGPIACILLINIILFAITACKIRAIKKDTSMLKRDENRRHCYQNNKQKFNLYIKLLFAMGINWLAEIISWFCYWTLNAPQYIWYLTDVCNAVYGVFIFFIFVFKKSIYNALKARYYNLIGRPYRAHSLRQNNVRNVSCSTTASNTMDNPRTSENEISSLPTAEA